MFIRRSLSAGGRILQNFKASFSTQSGPIHPMLCKPPPPPADLINPNHIPHGYYRTGLKSYLPADICLELRLTTTPRREPDYRLLRPLLPPDAPDLSIHGLRPSNVRYNVVYSQNEVIALNRDILEIDAIEEAIQIVMSQLYAAQISLPTMLSSWYSVNNERDQILFFIGKQLVKHTRYSEHVAVVDYMLKALDFALPLLNGGAEDLRFFLHSEGFLVGNYYEVSDLLASLKRKFGKDVYVTFKVDGISQIVYLDEIGLLRTIQSNLVDHPMAFMIPQGKFLLRNI